MLKFVSLGAAATAVMGTALGDYAARFAPAPISKPVNAEAQALTEARPLLQRLSLDVPDLAPGAAPVSAPARAVGALVAPPPFLAAARTSGDADRALECLTAAVYHEARSEGVDGQRAVAQVVLNRVRDRAFPSSVCGVVYQGSNRATGCQFSFTCDGSLNRPRQPAAWERAREIAAAALGGEVYAPVGSATHYHANYVSPWWAPSLARIGAVGAHIFYRWRGQLERALAFRQAYAGAEPGARPTSLRPAVATAGFDAGGDSRVQVHRFGGEVTAATEPRRTTFSAGVRVHRGSGGGGEPSADPGGSVQVVDGAVVGAEDSI